MRWRLVHIILLASWTTVTAQLLTDRVPVQFADKGYSVSESKIYRVSGGNGDIRSALSSLADEVSSDYGKLIKESQQKGAYEVIISLYGKAGDKIDHLGVRQELKQVEDRYFLQLHVHLGGGLKRQQLAYEFLEMLLHTKSLEALDKIPDGIVLSAPPWLVQGLLEASAWEKGEASRVKYEILKQSPKLFDVERLLALGKEDLYKLTGPSRELFEASAGAMVLGLLEQPEGVEGLEAMISSVSSFEGEIEDLLYGHFPGLNSGSRGMEKWWSLKVANMSLPKMTEVLDMEETELRMSEILHLYVRDELGQLNQVALSDYLDFIAMEEGDRRVVMEGVKNQLIRLNYRCFPLYRPIIIEYFNLIKMWERGEDKDSVILLESLSSERELMLSAAKRSRDYLDWYLITHSERASGDFDSYLRLKDTMEKERKQLADDLIDPYLDQMQKIWGQRKLQPSKP